MKVMCRNAVQFLIQVCFVHHIVNCSISPTSSTTRVYAGENAMSPTYRVFLGQLAANFSAYCNNRPLICCRDPTSTYRKTGRFLAFMTADDIRTMPGYPRQHSSDRMQTRLLFFFKPDCQLCRAVSGAFSRRRRRRRRQAEFNDVQREVTSDVVRNVLKLPDLTPSQESMAIAVEELLGYKVGYTRGSEDQQQPGSDKTTDSVVGGPGNSADGGGGMVDSTVTWWWVILLIVIGCILFILLIIALIIIICSCKRRFRRRKRVADSSTTGTRTTEPVRYETPPERPAAAAGDTRPVAQPVVIAQPHDVTSRRDERPGSSSSGDDVIGGPGESRTPQEGRTTVRRLED